MNSQIYIHKSSHCLNIEVIPDKNWCLIYFAVLVLWVFLGVCYVYLSHFICNNLLIIGIAFTFWLIGTGLMFFLAYWHLEGKEYITLKNDTMIHSLYIKNNSYSRHFKLSNIKDLRRSAFKDNISMGNIQSSFVDRNIYTGDIAFKYHNKTIHIGYQLDKKDAHEITIIIKNFIDSLIC